MTTLDDGIQRSRSKKRPIMVLAVLQVVAAIGFGVVVVNRFQVWSPIDEGAHFDYVHFIAQNKSLPVLGRDLTSEPVQRIYEARHPPDPDADPSVLGLGDYVYQAFQPPLYYLSAVPAYALTGDYLDKVIAVRYFDLALLASAIGILALLCRETFSDPWTPFTFGMSLILLPAVVVRSITVSNGALELPLVLLFLLFVVRSSNRPGMGDLAAASVVCGLCLLTKLTSAYVAVLFGLMAVWKFWGNRSPATALKVLGIGVIPALLVAPWLRFNWLHYGALTANEDARIMQQPIINPQQVDYTIGHLPAFYSKLANFSLPGEWWSIVEQNMAQRLSTGLLLALLAGPFLFILFPRRGSSAATKLILGLPLLANLGLLTGAALIANHDSIHARYFFPSLISWGLLAADAYSSVLSKRWIAALLPWGATLALSGLWADLIVNELLAKPPFPIP